MKRFLLLLTTAAAALVVALPATAATFTGAVVAKDAARKTLVTASRDGTVRTVRLHTGFARVKVGALLAVRGAQLPDGTYSAGAVRRAGRVRGTHLRGTVVQRAGARLVISAGGSVFALRVGGKQLASDGSSLQPGDKVDCDVTFRRGSPEAPTGGIHEVGHDGQLVLEGIYLTTDGDGTLEVAVVHKGRVLVAVPDGVTPPSFQAGDVVVLVVTVETDGSFTLVKAKNETDPGDGGDDGGGVDIHKEQFTVAGSIAALGVDGLSVKVPERPEAVRCTFPAGSDLVGGFAVGQWVSMTCKYGDGRLVLVSLTHRDPPPPPPPPTDVLGVVGTIGSLEGGQVAVRVDGRPDPVACDVPDGMNLLGFAEGDTVKLYCVKNADGDWVVKALVSDHAAITPDGSWFVLAGTIAALDATHISLNAEGRDDPVDCAVAPGADLSAFHVGDQVHMKCKLIGGAFTLKLLESATAHYELLG
jgi:hypothetical protein